MVNPHDDDGIRPVPGRPSSRRQGGDFQARQRVRPSSDFQAHPQPPLHQRPPEPLGAPSPLQPSTHPPRPQPTSSRRTLIAVGAAAVLAVGGGAAAVYGLSSRSDAASEVGAYPINRQLSSLPNWSVTLTTIEVSDSQMKVNVVYENVGAQPADLECPAQTSNYIQVGSDRLGETDSFCYDRVGRFTMQPGEQLASWGTYPRPEGDARRFLLHWFTWGDAQIVLP